MGGMEEGINLTRAEAVDIAATLLANATALMDTQYISGSVESRRWAEFFEAKLFGEEGGQT